MNSLASATSSRVDSASKHIVPCKVNTDYMAYMVGTGHSDAIRELQANKMKYCMHKDDVVIGLGRPTYGTSKLVCSKKAYPSVISTMATNHPAIRRWIALSNFVVQDQSDIVDFKKSYAAAIKPMDADGNMKFGNEEAMYVACKSIKPGPEVLLGVIDNLLDLYFVGISLGTAYAHSHSGDTVGSVMVGGLKTVLNGAYPVHTNDVLMFYFDDEAGFFEEDGGRIKREGNFLNAKFTDDMASFLLNDKIATVSDSAGKRKRYHDMGQGTYPGVSGKIDVARIKPYLHSKFGQDFPCDRRRIFGRAISNAQPFEMVDIVLSRQSI
jgi:hypothetical protein